MGFNVINKISEECDIPISHSKYKGLYGKGNIKNEKVVLLKPQTYMNLSGKSIIKFKKFYKLQNENIIIIYDDMDLNVGEIRIRGTGSPGTHNGMKSVIGSLGTEDIPRVRIGVGQANIGESAETHVLSKIPENEVAHIMEGANKAIKAIFEILENGIISAMNKFN